MIKELKNINDQKEIMEWENKLMDMLSNTRYDDDDNCILGCYLSFDIEDDLEIQVTEKYLRITLNEALHETTDSRDNNIKFIKMFVKAELPYYELETLREDYSSEHGFDLYFKRGESQ